MVEQRVVVIFLIGQNAQVGDSTSVVMSKTSLLLLEQALELIKRLHLVVILLLRVHGLEAINQLRLAVMLFLMVMHRLRLGGDDN